MRINTLVSFIGFVLIIAGTWSPILRPFHLFNLDAYDGNKPYGIVILLIATIGILGAFFNQTKTVNTMAWFSLGLVAVFYLLALLKVHTSFNFIPMHSLDAYLSRQIKFKWGWFLLFGGALLAVAGVLSAKKKSFN